MFKVLFYTSKNCATVYLNDGESSSTDVSLIIHQGSKRSAVYFHLFCVADRWYIARPDGFLWDDDDQEPIDRLITGELDISATDLEGRHFGILSREYFKNETVLRKYRMDDCLTIGKSGCDIELKGAYISERHGQINRLAGGKFEYKDHSKNGSFFNGRFIHNESTSLVVGDVISLACGFKLVFMGDIIAINSGEFISSIHASEIDAMIKYPQISNNGGVYTILKRPPHFIPTIVHETYQLELPPKMAEQQKQPLLLTIGPSLTMSLPMLMGSFLAGSGTYARSGIIMMITSSCLAITWTLANTAYTKKQQKKKHDEQMDDYVKRIGNVEEDISKGIDDVMKSVYRLYPSSEECCKLVDEHSDLVWEHTPEMSTFKMVRLGLGMIQLPYDIEVPKLKMGERPEGYDKIPYEMKDKYDHLHNAPVCIPMSAGLKSNIGIVTDARNIEAIYGLIIQLASLNSYVDLRIAIICKERERMLWHAFRWLPHTNYENDLSRHMVACDVRSAQIVLDHLNEILQTRIEGSKSENAQKVPHYIVFCNDLDLYQEHPFFINAERSDANFTICVIAENQYELPQNCSYIVDYAEGVLYNQEKHNKTVFKMESIDADLTVKAIRELAHLRENEHAENSAIPGKVALLEAFGAKSIEQLEIWRSWNVQHTYDSISANVGYRSGNRPFYLNLSDKAHGPHGIVAGTTGSGKSVFLQTLVLALAMRYHPEELQFILIDYKGGGAFSRFAGMPHVVGMIDNLSSKRAITRALYSVRGEVNRRLDLFKKVGVEDINDYIRRFNKDGQFKRLSHIIIIIDEFAEMKDEMPGFIEELVSTARVGRSVGLHLILATQKPAASVSGEIWSNSRFHVCLRVQTREDSMEMLHRPDAAYIRGMGRGFVQVGNDELFEQIQTSWHGATYNPAVLDESEKVRMLDSDGSAIRFDTEDITEGVSQSQAIVEEIKRIARDKQVVVPGQLWLDELEKCEAFEQMNLPQEMPTGKIEIPFAIADDVMNQRRLTASFDMNAYRCLAFLGPSGAGKTTAMQTIAYSISKLYHADEVQVLAVSFGGTQLDSLLSIPNIIDIIHGTSAFELRQLYFHLEKEAERRRQLFAAALVSTLDQYNAVAKENQQENVPALIVMIDRIGQWMEKLTDDEADKLTDYIKNAAGIGIYFIVSALDNGEIPFALRGSFVKIPLRQHAVADYSDILEHHLSNEVVLPQETAGRGIMLLDGLPYEFQIALAFGEENDAKRSKLINEYGETIIAPPVRKAISFVHIPNPMSAESLLKCVSKSEPGMMPIAIRQPDAVPIMLDCYQNPVVFVYGKPSTGKSTLLRSLAVLRAGEQGKVFVVAKNPEWERFAYNRQNTFIVNPNEDLRDWTDKLADELFSRNEKRKMNDEYDNPIKAREIASGFEPMCIILDDVETWYGNGLVELPSEFQTYIDNVIEKGRKYGISVFAGCGTGNSYSLPSEEISKLHFQGFGIALANTLSDYDPWHAELPYNKRYKEMKIGEGFVLSGNRYEMALLPAEVR